MFFGTPILLYMRDFISGPPPRSKPFAFASCMQIHIQKGQGQGQGFDVFHGGTIFLLHSPEKVQRFRHLGCGITPWHGPTMLRGTPKPSPKPIAGPPWG